MAETWFRMLGKAAIVMAKQDQHNFRHSWSCKVKLITFLCVKVLWNNIITLYIIYVKNINFRNYFIITSVNTNVFCNVYGSCYTHARARARDVCVSYPTIFIDFSIIRAGYNIASSALTCFPSMENISSNAKYFKFIIFSFLNKTI